MKIKRKISLCVDGETKSGFIEIGPIKRRRVLNKKTYIRWLCGVRITEVLEERMFVGGYDKIGAIISAFQLATQLVNGTNKSFRKKEVKRKVKLYQFEEGDNCALNMRFF